MSLYKDASLVMIPSAYKDGKLYSIRPTDGDGDFTFSRGSNLAATRVDVNGLIEKGRENVILYSNDFNNSDWGKAAILGIQSGQEGYDGSNDAWKVVPITGNSTHYVYKTTPYQTGVSTFSVYAKYSGYHAQLRVFNIGSGKAYASFDLQNGTKGTSGGTDIIDSTITSVGNGWYRISLSLNYTIDPYSAGIIPIESPTDGEIPSYAGDGTSGILIQDFQHEVGLVATDYIETGTSAAQSGILEDMPRLDYSGGASCPALLLEPQRTNVVKQSEYFESSEWIDQSIDTALELVSSGSPDGGAFYRCTSGASGGGRIVDVFTGSMSGGVFSLYAKGSGSLMIDLYITGGSNVTETITLTSEWTRYDVYNSRVDSGGDASIRFYPNAVADIYGAQLEQGSYPTSYIPTYGTSQTRSGESSSLTGASSIIGQTQGTIFVEYDFDETRSNNGGSDNDIIHLRNSSGELIKIVHYGNGSGSAYKKVYLYQYKNSQYEVTISSPVQSTGRMKVAAVYRENYYALFLNGVKVGEDLNAGVPSLDLIYLNKNTGLVQVTNPRHQAVLFPTALTDSECIALTTL